MEVSRQLDRQVSEMLRRQARPTSCRPLCNWIRGVRGQAVSPLEQRAALSLLLTLGRISEMAPDLRPLELSP